MLVGKETLLMDKLGNLPFDVTKSPYNSQDHESYQHRLEVIQESGEVIFVPSGWHHQVHNLVSDIYLYKYMYKEWYTTERYKPKIILMLLIRENACGDIKKTVTSP